MQAVEKEASAEGTASSEGGTASSEGSMQSILSQLVEVFESAVAAAYPDVPDAQAVVNPSTSLKFGDYQCNSAMMISKVRPIVAIWSVKTVSNGTA